MLERHMLGKLATRLWTHRRMAGLTGALQIQPQEKAGAEARGVAAFAAPCDC
jgi:hypothetical protein